MTHLLGCIFPIIISSFRFCEMKNNTFKTLQEQEKFYRQLFSFHLSIFYFSLHFSKVKMYDGNWVQDYTTEETTSRKIKITVP